MAFADIIFHNIQSRNAIFDGAGSYDYYLGAGDDGFAANRWTNSARERGNDANAPFWGKSVTGVDAPVAILLCETPVYANFHPNWQVNWQGFLPVLHGFEPAASANRLCAFWPGPFAPQDADPPEPNWTYVNGVYLQGTGIPLGGAAPPGSDRYGIRFELHWHYSDEAVRVGGIFVHTKNTRADPGTQIAALCREFPNDIIFGDLNLNLRDGLKLASLASAVGGTHQILALQQQGGQFYHTRYNAAGGGTSCLDFALVPLARVENVVVWAQDPGAAAPVLTRNGSDHSVMKLRIHVEAPGHEMG